MTNGVACEILDQHRRREKTIKFTTLFLCTNKMVFYLHLNLRCCQSSSGIYHGDNP